LCGRTDAAISDRLAWASILARNALVVNLLAQRHWLVKTTLVALLATIGLVLLGTDQAPPACGQSPGMEYPSGSPYGNYNTTPYIPGQQLVPGTSIAPTQSSRPAGWPGGQGNDPAPPPVRRRSYAAPFNSTAAGPAATGQPAGTQPVGTQPVGTQPAGTQPTNMQPPVGPRAVTQPRVAGPRVAAPGVAGAATVNSGLGGGLAPGAQAGRPVVNNLDPRAMQTSYATPASAAPAVAAVPATMVVASPALGGSLPPGSSAMPPANYPPPGNRAAPPGNNVQTVSAMQPFDGVAPAAAAASAIPVAGGEASVEQPPEQPKRQSVPFGVPATFSGAEIIAWVGPEPILASDVLPDANRTLQRIMERAPRPPTPEELENARKMYMSKFLERLIETKLVIVEGRRAIPKEAWPKIEKQFNEQFDKEYLPKMLEAEECRSRTELDAKLRKAGSSLDGLKRQSMENSFAGHWLEEKVKDDHEITHEEMHTYYRAHLASYETPAKVRWEHLMARFDKFNSKDEAWQAIAGWGNQVVAGTPFAEVAQAHSQDPSAVDGGVHSWTTKDSLASEVIDDAIFTLPVGQLSQIIEDSRGFHIIRILERHDLEVSPFTDKQAEIKSKIHEERTADKRQEYKAKLRKKVPVWNIFEDADKRRAEEETLQAAKQSGADTTTR
jgi:PPIC-type PPIASE domain